MNNSSNGNDSEKNEKSQSESSYSLHGSESIVDENKISILFQLREWRAFITPRTAVVVLYVVGFLFITIGTVFFVITDNLFFFEIRYDDICDGKTNCKVWLNTTEDINGKISIQYKLYGFHQNHRRMMESRSHSQLNGEFLNYDQLYNCAPEISVNNSKDIKDVYVPCGQMARSFFNDSYVWNHPTIANFTETGIAIKSDKDGLYKAINNGYKNSVRWLKEYTDFPGEVENEHFIVWMRTAAMPTFLKLYAKCYDCVIPAGNYSISINMNYPKEMFSGKRSLVFSTTGPLGSGSKFISISYVAIGGVAIIFATCFLVHMIMCPREFGDLSAIWQNPATGNIVFDSRSS